MNIINHLPFRFLSPWLRTGHYYPLSYTWMNYKQSHIWLVTQVMCNMQHSIISAEPSPQEQCVCASRVRHMKKMVKIMSSKPRTCSGSYTDWWPNVTLYGQYKMNVWRWLTCAQGSFSNVLKKNSDVHQLRGVSDIWLTSIRSHVNVCALKADLFDLQPTCHLFYEIHLSYCMYFCMGFCMCIFGFIKSTVYCC